MNFRGKVVTMRFQSQGPMTPVIVRRMMTQRTICLQHLPKSDVFEFMDSNPSDAQLKSFFRCLIKGYEKAGVVTTYTIGSESKK